MERYAIIGKGKKSDDRIDKRQTIMKKVVKTLTGENFEIGK